MKPADGFRLLGGGDGVKKLESGNKEQENQDAIGK
jgi:hypothetical protein